KALETLVTSSGWGARPAERRQSPPHGQKGESRVERLAVPSPQASTSLGAAVGGGLTSGRRATFTIVALLCLLAAFTVVRVRRRRASRWAQRYPRVNRGRSGACSSSAAIQVDAAGAASLPGARPGRVRRASARALSRRSNGRPRTAPLPAARARGHRSRRD